ncbi:MAG: hypothetical protein KGZ91_05260 [Afipia sp.]|jgi:hypothetical protein|nr:hypothetical protein [Afipia sp.]WIG50118.1 MAG: hypothetical protein OJF48_001035 [Afipia sp.]
MEQRQYLIYDAAMSTSARYGTLHWIRVLLWPRPVLTIVRMWRRRGRL